MLNVLNEELILWIVTYYESLHDGDLKMIGVASRLRNLGIDMNDVMGALLP